MAIKIPTTTKKAAITKISFDKIILEWKSTRSEWKLHRKNNYINTIGQSTSGRMILLLQEYYYEEVIIIQQDNNN